MEDNLHEGHRDRIRKEFLRHGFDKNTPPHKILEILLFYCVPRTDTNPIAHELIARYGTVAGVLDAPIEELAAFKGMSERSAVLLKLIMPIARRYLYDKSEEKPTFSGLDQIGEYIFRHYVGITREKFSFMGLDAMGKLINFEFIGDGDISSVGISMRDLTKIALNSGSTAAVLAHNHPNGIAMPSETDIQITCETVRLFARLDIRLIDHIIVSGSDFVSMAQSEKYGYIFAP